MTCCAQAVCCPAVLPASRRVARAWPVTERAADWGLLFLAGVTAAWAGIASLFSIAR